MELKSFNSVKDFKTFEETDSSRICARTKKILEDILVRYKETKPAYSESNFRTDKDFATSVKVLGDGLASVLDNESHEGLLAGLYFSHKYLEKGKEVPEGILPLCSLMKVIKDGVFNTETRGVSWHDLAVYLNSENHVEPNNSKEFLYIFGEKCPTVINEWRFEPKGLTLKHEVPLYHFLSDKAQERVKDFQSIFYLEDLNSFELNDIINVILERVGLALVKANCPIHEDFFTLMTECAILHHRRDSIVVNYDEFAEEVKQMLEDNSYGLLN